MTTFKEKATMSKVTMPNPNQTNINSKDNLIYSSAKGSNVVVHVDPLDPMSFMSWIPQTTLSAIVIISDPPPFIWPIGQFFQLLELEHGNIRRDRMQNTQDFQREMDDTSCTMYTRLAWFNKESWDVFTEW